jgi:Flp pilus assembly pilin Flp
MAAKERSERGAALVEYAMIVSFIAVVSLSTVGMVGTGISGDIAAVGSALSDGADLGGDDDGQGQESGDDAESGDNGNNGNAGNDNDNDGNQGNGGDNGNDDNGGVDDDFGDDAGDTGDTGSGGDNGGDDAGEVEEDPSSSVDVVASAGSFYWWTPAKNGGDGAWNASVTFQNDWIRDQYLTVEVTRTASNGDTTTETVEVYVAAGSTGTYDAWNNNYSVRGKSESGVVSVTVRVTSIRTYDESWQTETHSTTGPTVEVAVPDVG